MKTQRQLGPDVVRGALLSLVIFGHTFQESVDQSHLKWMIYAFHMPLFFALTGSLISFEKLHQQSFSKFVSYYARRMGWQWLVATLLFALYRGVDYHSAAEVVEDLLLDPYFHLWFIPALFVMVLATWILLRIGASPVVLIILGALTFVIFDALQLQNSISWFNAESVDYRFAALYFWFVLGNFMAKRAPINFWIVGLCIGVGAVGMWEAFASNSALRDVSFFILNFGLVGLLARLINSHLINRRDKFAPLYWLAPIGQFSLWIYLLHPLATDFLRRSELPHPRWQGVLMTLAVLCISSAAINYGRFVRKNR